MLFDSGMLLFFHWLSNSAIYRAHLASFPVRSEAQQAYS